MNTILYCFCDFNSIQKIIFLLVYISIIYKNENNICYLIIPSRPNKTTLLLFGFVSLSSSSICIKIGILSEVPDNIHSPGANIVKKFNAFSSKNATAFLI